MADKRITDLTELTSGNINGSDVMPIVDVSDTTMGPSGTTKKTLMSSILAYIASATATLTNKTLSTGTAITGGTINGTSIGATTASTGAFTNLSYSGTLTGGTGVVNLGSGQLVKDAAGNLGLGVTPSAWNTNAAAIDMRGFSAISGASSIELDANTFKNTSNQYIYKANGAATQYAQFNGGHSWLTAPSGTAGSTISFTRAMTLDASGNLGVGTSSPNNNLQVKTASDGGGITIQRDSSTADTYAQLSFLLTTGDSGSSTAWMRGVRGSSVGLSSLVFGTSATERLRITSEGNVGIGTSSPSQALHVVSSQNQALFEGSNQGNITIRKAGTAGMGIYSNAAGTLQIYDNTAAATRLTLDSSGNVGIGTSAPTNLLDVNANSIRVRTARTPASATATGTQGEIAWDANYVYVCVATNTWKRTALSTW